VVLKRLKRTVC